jgi:hypothetical protein
MDKSEAESILLHELQPELQRASQLYADRIALRALIQGIPYIGGPLDTLLLGPAAEWRERRILSFLKGLSDRLARVETQAFEPSENSLSFIVDTIDHAARTRSAVKRARFAQIVTRQVVTRATWDDAEAAVRLLAGLSDADVAILSAAVSAPLCDSPFDGYKVVSIKKEREEWKGRPIELPVVFPDFSPPAIRYSVSELASRGLLRDEGVGRFDLESMTYFVSTELGLWFIEWLNENPASNNPPNPRGQR